MDVATGVAVTNIDTLSEPRPIGSADRIVTVTATYELSEPGRKASLVAGGDGRATQQVSIPLPASRLHLVTVDADGVARLKLRPHFHVDALQRVVRVDRLPTYDAPPTIDDLLKDAARSHQLERTFYAERLASRTKRREAGREGRQQLAQQFLKDQAQRALPHPVPTPTRCYLAGPEGRIRFDTESDDGPARQVPAEAHRRFRTDLRARAERKRQERAAQLAIWEEKQRVMTEWVAAHGTPEQRVRHSAGALPMAEVVDAITDEAFQPLSGWPIYARDGADRLQAHIRTFSEYATATVTLADLMITVHDAKIMSQAQWALVEALQQALPGATVTLRAHRLAWKHDPHAPGITVFGARVKYKHGPFMLCREYAAPDA